MRYMRNLRTGKVAVYDADLVEGGRWEECAAPSQEKQDKPKGVPIPKLRGIGTLAVQPAKGDRNEGVKRKA